MFALAAEPLVVSRVLKFSELRLAWGLTLRLEAEAEGRIGAEAVDGPEIEAEFEFDSDDMYLTSRD